LVQLVGVNVRACGGAWKNIVSSGAEFLLYIKQSQYKKKNRQSSCR